MPFSARIGFYQDQIAVGPPPAGFPDWPTVATESEMLTEMATWGNSAVSTASTFSLSGGPTTLINATTCPDGRITMASYQNGSKIYIYDTTSNTSVTTTTTHNGTRCACLNPDGNVYFGPQASTTFTRLDASSNTATSFTLSVDAGYRALGMSSIPDGNIIMAPGLSGDSFYKYDPVNDVLVNLGRTASANNEFDGQCTALNGNVYFAPTASNDILKYDPTANTFTTITPSPTITGTASYTGAHLSPSGNIYFMPFNEEFVMWIDPTDDSVYFDTEDLSAEGTEKFRSGALAGDGRIYSLGYREGGNAPDGVLIIDENTSPKARVETYGITYQDDRAIGAAADFNGRVINARLTAVTQLLNIDTKATAYEGNAVLQPYIAGS